MHKEEKKKDGKHHAMPSMVKSMAQEKPKKDGKHSKGK